MADENFISTLLGMLSGNAQPRPDIIAPGSTGTPENARPYTYLGRVGYAGKEPPNLTQMPQGDTEEGQGIFQTGVEGLKRILPQAASDLAKTAPGAALASIPAAVWKGYSPEAKAAMNVYATKYPENFARILQQPEQLFTRVLNQDEMGAPNILGRLRDLASNADQQAVKGGQAELLLSKRAIDNPTLIPHEIQHYFDIGEPFPHLPSQQEKMARSIRDLLGRENTGSLNSALDYKIPIANKIIDMTLKDKGKIFSQDTEMLHGWQNVAMREARAYIAEALTKPNVKPQIKALAEQMGIAAK